MTTDNRLEWRKSSFSGNGENCVEIAPSHGWPTTSHITPSDSHIYMRHSKHHDAGTIIFDLTAWHQFLTHARTNISSGCTPVTITHTSDNTHVHCQTTHVSLHYNQGEWAAFQAGVSNGEFAFHPR